MSEAALPAGWPAMSIQQAHALLTQPGSPLEVEETLIDGVPMKVWKHLPPSLRAARSPAADHGAAAAALHPAQVLGSLSDRGSAIEACRGDGNVGLRHFRRQYPRHDPLSGIHGGVKPALDKAGAKYLARGGAHKVYEGDWEPRRIVLLEFPDVKAWEEFYYGPVYQGLKAVRDACSEARLVSVEGL